MTPRPQECLVCRRSMPVELFPLGRPRKDGVRMPMAVCEDCRSEGRSMDPDARLARDRQTKRDYMRRVRDAAWKTACTCPHPPHTPGQYPVSFYDGRIGPPTMQVSSQTPPEARS